MTTADIYAPSSAAGRLAAHKSEVLQRWEDRVRRSVAAAQGESKLTLRDDIPKYLDELIAALTAPLSSCPECEETSACAAHAEQRSQQADYSLAEALKEYEILHAVIVRVLNDSGGMTPAERAVIDRSIHGGIQAVATVFIDARERSEAAAHQSRERLDFALEASHMGAWELCFDTDMIEGNDYFNSLFHLAAGEPIPWSALWASRLHPDDRERVQANLDEAIAQRTLHSSEYRVLGPAGQVRWIRARGRCALSEQGQRPLRMYGTVIDVTEEKETEAHLLATMAQIRLLASELQQQAKTFDSILSLVPNFLWILDPSHRFVYANRALLTSLNRALADVVGHAYEDLMALPEASNSLSKMLDQVLTGSTVEGETETVDAYGERHFYAYTLLPVVDDSGRIVAICGSNHDITARKRLETAGLAAKLAAEEANRAKSSFLANMSHEIRTPLSALLGFSELLKASNLTVNERREFIDAISRNGKQLAQLVDDILDLSKVEAGRLQIERVQVALADIVRDVVQLLSVKAREQGIALEVAAVGDVPRVIESDPARLRQTLINIIGNAVKFTSRGKVTVLISYTDQGGERQLSFAVQDTGRGIAAADQEQLFQPFMQGDSSTTRLFGGTGLGLGLARRLARLLGGDVVLTSSTLGEGSVFTVSINPGQVGPEVWSAAAWEKSVAALPVPLAMKPRSRLQGLRILVAEDTPDNRFLIKRLLSREGAEVTLAENGQQAVDLASRNAYDVILMDIQMPVMDGYQAAQMILERSGTIAIIALTAHAMKDDGIKSMRSGCVDHLTKPMSPELVVSTILRHAKRY